MPKRDFLDAIQELGLTQRRAAQLLQQGNNIFWWQSGEYIRLVGLARMGDALPLDTNEGTRVYIPLGAFFDLPTFKAHLYASWFAHSTQRHVWVRDGVVSPDGGKIISRAALRSLFGITKYTQRTYEDLAGMQVEAQVAVYKMSDTAVENIPFTESFLEGEHGGVWYFDVDGDGKHEVVRQIPNRLGSTLEVAKHKKRVKPVGSSLYRGADPTRYLRTYFYQKEPAITAIIKHRTRSGVAYVRQQRFFELQRGRYFRAWEAIV